MRAQWVGGESSGPLPCVLVRVRVGFFLGDRTCAGNGWVENVGGEVAIAPPEEEVSPVSEQAIKPERVCEVRSRFKRTPP
ncbi:hypothetical protein NG799_04360 [Laspinema sp. D1]|uniref:Uncharacterized protein n=1 Tax=Laspinema palackyanum D2a TaxID=2953684 RepID=A0ABT2MM42_9CYAN|nr:hypothetical protein [Laspinema sp. D2a]